MPKERAFKEIMKKHHMRWPGTSDPYKRKKTIRFLIISAIIGISVAAVFAFTMSVLDRDNPLKVCINDRNTPYKITASLELIVDGQPAEIPARVGFEQRDILNEDCQRSLYTLNNDGTIYAEWEEEYPFELGHFLWTWDFPLRDMDQSKSTIYVNDEKSEDFIHHLLQDGYQYKAVFTSKAYDTSKDQDFLPPEN